MSTEDLFTKALDSASIARLGPPTPPPTPSPTIQPLSKEHCHTKLASKLRQHKLKSNKMASSTATTHVPPSNASAQVPTSKHKHIWVITGPAGCGKTSVAEYLHSTFSLPYLEGDTVSTVTPSR